MFSDVIELIRKEQVTLFLGAGFSLKAGAPSGHHLMNIIKSAAIEATSDEQSKYYLESVNDLSKISEEFTQLCNDDRSKINEILIRTFNFEYTDLTDHRLLCQIPNFRHIITTNYDSLLEDCYGDKAQVIRYDDDLANINAKKVNIFKIHGDLIALDRIIITTHDYTNFFSKQSNKGIWNFVLNEFLTRNILFIGYSLEDENLFTLIEKVREYAPNGTKRMFLLAPDIPQHKQTRLSRYGITYYNAIAETFLKNLYKNLEDNIVSDFEAKEVSNETLSQFIAEKGLEAVTKVTPQANYLDNLLFTTSEREIRLNFSTNKETVDRITQERFEPINLGTLKTNNGDIELPKHMVGLKLTDQEIRNTCVKYNGISMANQPSELIIMPAIKNTKAKIKLVNEGFQQRVTFQGFRSGPNSVSYAMKCELFELTFIQRMNQDRIVEGLDINLDFNKVIKGSLRNALRWCDFIIAVWEGKTIRIKEIMNMDFHFPKSDKTELQTFKCIGKYLENLIYLEEEHDIEFTRYDAMTPELLEISQILYSYFSHQGRTRQIPKDSILTFEIDNLCSEPPKIGQTYTFSMTSTKGSIKNFNGYDLDIPYCYDIYPSCKVLEVKTMDKSTRIVIEPEKQDRYTYYLDHEFNPNDKSIQLLD